MHKSIVRKAAHAFSAGRYSEALNFYQQGCDLLGHHHFRANIAIAEKRLLQSRKRKDYAATPASQIKVACVMDEFTFHSYEPECTLLQLTPDHAITELENFNPDLLFIESAWRGKEELWARKIGTLSTELKAVLQWCKQRNVPTVFWNKEDPVHFETFLTTAQQFDYVFTTDIDCIARYKQALSHNRIYLLPFACQPKTHNPIELYPRKDAICFAGAYYVRYPERTRDLENYVAEFPQFKPLEIFDRNFGKDDVNYQFPPQYQPYIVGTLPFNEIDKAYKGYRYSINLNSVKQSQSMFARRIYELLGSNTITVSNFSRGVRLLFGDLVITSDSGKEIIERLRRLTQEDEQKLRLAGLRKVMLEHTYAHRLAYVLSKALGRPMQSSLPTMQVIAVANRPDDCRKVLENFRRQSCADKRLLLVTGPDYRPATDALPGDETITFVETIEQANTKIAELASSTNWIAPMVPADYYGPNYLLDLALATGYSQAHVLGKVAHYQFESAVQLTDADCAYRPAPQIAQRSSAIRLSALPKEQFDNPAWLGSLAQASWQLPGLALDAFNYCRNGMQAPNLSAIAKRVNDLQLDNGLPCDQLISAAESIEAAKQGDTDLPRWTGQRLMDLVRSTHAQIQFTVDERGLAVHSTLPDGKHHYLYSAQDLPLESLPATQVLETHLEASPGLDTQYVLVFLDATKKKISHAIHNANRNHTTAVPEGTAFVRFGWRVLGNGTCTVKTLLWGHRTFDTNTIIGRGEHLVLSNHYPSYDDLYRYAFVHTRVAAYAKRGVKVDVFRLRGQGAISYHEFQNVDVITGSAEALDTLLSKGNYRSVLVHFLDEAMWNVLQHHIEKTKVVVWVHGAEIQPWHRRDYNFTNDAEREAAKVQSEIRMAFWRSLLANMPRNLKLVFVSKYFAEEVMEDLGFRLPDQAYSIIHNPIDTELFSYESKPAEQRKKILSIRPYASRKYANDLSVAAIIELSKKPFFNELDFRIIGDGTLFENTLAPLRQFGNVKIERRFLTHPEIARLHKEYGIFLSPTRMDAQGVSRDEAMSSGLVPITNAVAAIPEFVDETCGVLAPAEDAVALADGIARLYESPTLFAQLSKGATQRVMLQTAASRVVAQEISLIKPVTTKITNERPISFISFDVEALPGRAAQDHVEQLIWGRFDGKEYGIRRISSILKQYAIKGNFLVDFAACLLYGDKVVREITDFLLEEGHEVHVHLHSEWVVRKWGLKNKAWENGPAGMEVFDEEVSRAMLKFSSFKYRALVGLDPLVFRAGGFQFNAATISAARQVGFKACSNYNNTRHAAKWASQDDRAIKNNTFRWENGLIELPVDFSPEPLSHDWDAYQGAFDRVLSFKKSRTFNLTLHSTSLLTREKGRYFTGFCAAHEERLHKICQHLKENSNPMGYAEYLAHDFDTPLVGDLHCTLAPSKISDSTTHCSICGAIYGLQLTGDVCPSCGSRARHRQILDVLNEIGNPFTGRSVLACHANPIEMQVFLANASKVVNFDVRPLGFADLQMDIQAMDKVADGTFQTFVAIHVLNHVADDRKALKEIHRILENGGVALITVPCRENASTEALTNIVEHYGEDALNKFGVGSYRRYGLNDAIGLFSEYFVVRNYKGLDDLTSTHEQVFLLTKK